MISKLKIVKNLFKEHKRVLLMYVLCPYSIYIYIYCRCIPYIIVVADDGENPYIIKVGLNLTLRAQLTVCLMSVALQAKAHACLTVWVFILGFFGFLS